VSNYQAITSRVPVPLNNSWRRAPRRDCPWTWRAYERVPRKAVLRLRSLVARGRATTADPVFKALFASPNEIVWHVLSFWDARIE